MEKLVNSRLEKLENDRNRIAGMLDKVGIEHSGHFLQSARVEMLVERCEGADRRNVKLAVERNELRDMVKELRAQLADCRLCISQGDEHE